jgi:hypothetical protein
MVVEEVKGIWVWLSLVQKEEVLLLLSRAHRASGRRSCTAGGEEVAVPLEEKKLHRWILGDDILMVVTVVVPTVLMRSRHPCWRTNAGL